jgi:hypothetical protein
MRKLTIVEKDHREMIIDGEFAYCPYCGFQLKKRNPKSKEAME